MPQDVEAAGVLGALRAFGAVARGTAIRTGKLHDGDELGGKPVPSAEAVPAERGKSGASSLPDFLFFSHAKRRGCERTSRRLRSVLAATKEKGLSRRVEGSPSRVDPPGLKPLSQSCAAPRIGCSSGGREFYPPRILRNQPPTCCHPPPHWRAFLRRRAAKSPGHVLTRIDPPALLP